MPRGKVPRLLELFAAEGRTTERLLEELEQIVDEFDALGAPGWSATRRRLGRERRPQFMAVLSEISVAYWAHRAGLRVLAFEPATEAARRADLLLSLGVEELLVEVATPRPPAADWTEEANARLVEGLTRVQSGLVIEVRGMDPLQFDPSGMTRTKRVPLAIVDAIVTEFARRASGVRSLPVEVVAPCDGQPVRIVAVGCHGSRGTRVLQHHSRSGLVPAVSRFAEIVRRECRQVRDHADRAVVVDLSNWNDFRGDRYYQDAVAAELRPHDSAEVVLTFDCRGGSMDPLGRHVLHLDPAWAQRPVGGHLLGAWTS
jgi:hypothetical protein